MVAPTWCHHTETSFRTCVGSLLLALLALSAPRAGWAQLPDSARPVSYQPDAVSTGEFATRASLQQAANGNTTTAAIARERLENGDFNVGDRIAVSVADLPALTDTFTVREGQILRLPNMPDIALHGVLHAELQDSLTRVIGRFVKDPTVRATPLVRLAVLGQVARPGYYSAAADELVSTLLMHAGGLTTTSDLGKTVVRRGPEVLYPAKALQSAMAHGETIDQLALQPGDQIVVGEHPPGGNALRYLGIIGAIAGIGVSIAIIATR